MRHYKKGRKLGTDKSHTIAMKRSLVSSLFLNDRIITIESRAKEIRSDCDKIIKWAKRGDLHSRRLAIAALGGDKYLVAEIFDKVSQGMFKERNSGYTRIIKLGNRKGDNASMVIIELINEGAKKQEKKSSKRPIKNAIGKRKDQKAEKEDKSLEDKTSSDSNKKDDAKEESSKEDKDEQNSKKSSEGDKSKSSEVEKVATDEDPKKSEGDKASESSAKDSKQDSNAEKDTKTPSDDAK